MRIFVSESRADASGDLVLCGGLKLVPCVLLHAAAQRASLAHAVAGGHVVTHHGAGPGHSATV